VSRQSCKVEPCWNFMCWRLPSNKHFHQDTAERRQVFYLSPHSMELLTT
jgi:hypothetical protein